MTLYLKCVRGVEGLNTSQLGTTAVAPVLNLACLYNTFLTKTFITFRCRHYNLVRGFIYVVVSRSIVSVD